MVVFTHTFLASLSQLDKMNTSPQPAPSYHLFFSFLFFMLCFFACCLTMMQSAAGSMLHRSSHWICRCCLGPTQCRIEILLWHCAETDELGPTAFQYWPTLKYMRANGSLKHYFPLYSYSHCVQRFVYRTILFQVFCMWLDYDFLY